MDSREQEDISEREAIFIRYIQDIKRTGKTDIHEKRTHRHRRKVFPGTCRKNRYDELSQQFSSPNRKGIMSETTQK
jgi:hypothetical protein